jgi:23S rRNA (cytosine1962-C5)-methyltransferase
LSAKRAVVHLVANADRRIRVGHQWIFSNEADALKSPVASFKPGEIVEVRDARNNPVGTAYVNPGALIFGRLLSSDLHAKIDNRWFVNRIERALELREKLYREPYYRAIYGEADGLPGLVVDRYGDVLVAQLNTAGTRALRETIVSALRQALDPRGMWLSSAGSILELEGIPALDEVIGEVPDEVEVPEGGCTYLAPLRAGQKTGFYYDQRDNRRELRRYVRDARVLDVYSYVGAWGVGAAKAGANEVVCVDSSEQALAYASRNAARNGVQIETEEGSALDVMRRFALEKRRFDVVVVDPPALVKRKKDLAAGAAHYESINEAAMNLIDRDGFLVSSSCSHHLDAERLRSVLLHAAKKAGKRVQLLERRGHPPDHPIVPAMNETEYLKAWFCRVD